MEEAENKPQLDESGREQGIMAGERRPQCRARRERVLPSPLTTGPEAFWGTTARQVCGAAIFRRPTGPAAFSRVGATRWDRDGGRSNAGLAAFAEEA